MTEERDKAMTEDRQEQVRRIMDNAVLPHLASLPKFMFDRVSLEMGAVDEFDFAFDSPKFEDRITRCYELAGRAFIHDWSRIEVLEKPDLPEPALLIHGQWSSPDTPDSPIAHAWVMLDNEQVWEPITMTLCDPDVFYSYTQGTQEKMYGIGQARLSMLAHGHFGPW